MNGYKGKVVFVKDPTDGLYSVWHGTMAEAAMAGRLSNTIVLGVVDVDVKFEDTRTQEIEVIEKKIEAERAESQMRINVMLGRIQELRALEHAG